jgi:hypothetical protein
LEPSPDDWTLNTNDNDLEDCSEVTKGSTWKAKLNLASFSIVMCACAHSFTPLPYFFNMYFTKRQTPITFKKKKKKKKNIS